MIKIEMNNAWSVGFISRSNTSKFKKLIKVVIWSLLSIEKQ